MEVRERRGSRSISRWEEPVDDDEVERPVAHDVVGDVHVAARAYAMGRLISSRAETVDRVVVDQADRLHERVADGQAYEEETAVLQVGFSALESSVSAGSSRVRHQFTIGSPSTNPQVGGEAPGSSAPPGATRVDDRRLDLQSVPNDSGSASKRSTSAAVNGDHGQVESPECTPVALALPQDRRPGKARLRSFEREHLEEMGVIVRRDTPLLVVVGEHELVSSGCPLAPLRVGHRRIGSHAMRVSSSLSRCLSSPQAAVAMGQPIRRRRRVPNVSVDAPGRGSWLRTKRRRRRSTPEKTYALTFDTVAGRSP